MPDGALSTAAVMATRMRIAETSAVPSTAARVSRKEICAGARPSGDSAWDTTLGGP